MNDFEFLFTIETDDSEIESEMIAAFEGHEVSVGDNFTGGAEIVAFLTANSTTIATIIGSILGFLAARQGRYAKASITIGKKQISLAGYSPEEVERLMSTDAVRDSMKTVQ